MRKTILLYIVLFVGLSLDAQTLTQARELLVQGSYEQAMPVFRKELARKPNDASLNYWYGVCLYHLQDKQAAVRHLTIGEKGRIKEASYLLADAAFERRDFTACQNHLDRYILYNTGKHQSEIAYMVRLCSLYPKMLPQTEDVLVFDSVIVHKDNVLDVIKLHPSCGKLALWNGTLVYMNEKGNLCYTSDSIKGKGRDIVRYNKMPDSWERENLDGQLNSAYNENCPFVLNDGVTIYFASDQPGGLGGYDLYVSRYSAVSEDFFKPEALPFPFNSTANDYAYIVDEVLGRGYLVSDRRQDKDSLIVYSFIPNSYRRVVQGKTDDELLQLAELSSIAATWNGINADSVKTVLEQKYREAMQHFSQDEQKAGESNHDISLLIYDDIYYSSADDCHSDEGKSHFEECVRLFKAQQQLQKTLDKNRSQFAHSTKGSEQRRRIASRIHAAENNLLQLQASYNSHLQALRQAEIPYLTK